jgi:hypothetical protein
LVYALENLAGLLLQETAAVAAQICLCRFVFYIRFGLLDLRFRFYASRQKLARIIFVLLALGRNWCRR